MALYNLDVSGILRPEGSIFEKVCVTLTRNLALIGIIRGVFTIVLEGVIQPLGTLFFTCKLRLLGTLHFIGTVKNKMTIVLGGTMKVFGEYVITSPFIYHVKRNLLLSGEISTYTIHSRVVTIIVNIYQRVLIRLRSIGWH